MSCFPHAVPRGATIALLIGALSGCDGSSGGVPDAGAPAAAPDTEDPVAALRAAHDAAIALADSVEALLRPVPLLTPGEEAALRTSNAAQLARARRLGEHVADSASLERLIGAGALVQLQDSTQWWVVRELDHSLPYVTPDVVLLLEQIGRRFQDALGAMGLPRYRLEVTSVLRTPAGQAALREGNVNAAAGTSTHEYGTTLDIAYESYAAPLVDAAAGAGEVEWLAERIRTLAMERVAAVKSRELQKLLGGVLRDMQAEGLLLVTLERQQPVYHLTVARSLADG
ncbi:MAG TPA: DUF5715 family protein [Longimicrobiales bacterium]|nr:DUF5715 family protein [Longimicrobiales bacterium]